jgi:uncharacterized protein (DUF1810 family)
MVEGGDPFGLERFVEAQDRAYDRALAELKSGRKRSHWMWYIFPQLEGLGHSSMARRYSIKSLDEARAYLAHPVLGMRLQKCVDTLLRLEAGTAHDIFGSPDDLKLRSCATLFAEVSPPDSAFHRLLAKYFQGQPDLHTLRLLNNNCSTSRRQIPG